MYQAQGLEDWYLLRLTGRLLVLVWLVHWQTVYCGAHNPTLE